MTRASARGEEADFATRARGVKQHAKVLTSASAADKYSADLASGHGAVAQLGERLNGIQEADGSIPFSSTK